MSAAFESAYPKHTEVLHIAATDSAATGGLLKGILLFVRAPALSCSTLQAITPPASTIALIDVSREVYAGGMPGHALHPRSSWAVVAEDELNTRAGRGQKIGLPGLLRRLGRVAA